MFPISISQTKSFLGFSAARTSHMRVQMCEIVTHIFARDPASEFVFIRLIEFQWNISKYRKKSQKIVKMSLNSAGNSQNIIREMKNLFLFSCLSNKLKII